MAESIRLFSSRLCEPEYMVRERLIHRLTKIATFVVGVQTLVLAFSLIARVVEASAEASVQSHTMPYIPPKPDFKATH